MRNPESILVNISEIEAIGFSSLQPVSKLEHPEWRLGLVTASSDMSIIHTVMQISTHFCRSCRPPFKTLAHNFLWPGLSLSQCPQTRMVYLSEICLSCMIYTDSRPCTQPVRMGGYIVMSQSAFSLLSHVRSSCCRFQRQFSRCTNML
jgi:hypothetical protein